MEIFKRKFSEIMKILSEEKAYIGHPSLISGDLSIILFHLQTFEFTQNTQLFDEAIEKLEEYLDKIVIENINPTYCTGFAGLGFLVEYIEQKGWIEIDTNDLLGDIDEYLYDKMMSLIKIGNYDFLHGAMGIGFYFIYRSRKTKIAHKYLEDLIIELEKQAIVQADGSIKWSFYDFVRNKIIKDEFNMGLSHGIPSILTFLLKAFRENILPEKTLKMVRATVKYMLRTKLEPADNNSEFPDYINEEANQAVSTRLAWCYGDLGVCCSLWQVAITLNDPNLQNEVIAILKRAALKRTIHQTRIVDAGLCHGSAGAAHIFQRFYDWTKVPEFKEAADYWYEVILQMAVHEKGYAGYIAHAPKEYGGDKPDATFLEGISGIGLVLLYKISGLDPSWEELLFIR
jgi:lantibiotic biosynthesis protein